MIRYPPKTLTKILISLRVLKVALIDEKRNKKKQLKKTNNPTSTVNFAHSDSNIPFNFTGEPSLDKKREPTNGKQKKVFEGLLTF